MTNQWRCPACGATVEVAYDEIAAYCEECGTMSNDPEVDE